MKKILHSTMKENNYALILRTIMHNKSIERVNLVRQTGLSPSTVTRCVSQLVQNKVILETGPSEQSGVGRKAINLEVNPEILNVLLIDIGAERTNYALGKANGNMVKLESTKTPDEFEEIIGDVLSIIRSCNNISVVAFSIPGMVDTDNDTILFVPSKGWKNIKIEIPGKVVYADNEANLGMIAEAFQHEEIRKSKCSVFVTVREGVGTGLWINGEIFRGPSFTAGEFGHTIFDLSSNLKCHCGNVGCLEEYVSISSFFGKSNKDWKKHLNKLYNSNDERIENYVELLTKALTNIVNALNPEYLIIGGELSGLVEEFYKYIEKKLKEKVLEHSRNILKVLPSTFTHDTYLYGALYAVLEEYFIPETIQRL
ncbi:MAG: ROK family transcriptional regulator [Fervidobacterium sp.]|nr:ROK family transcriptional regulator [Fervidobacterium sp.]